MQSRFGSLAEASLNTLSGFVVSLVVLNLIVNPLYDLQVNAQQSLGITAIFTVASVIRSYLWRRYFNSIQNKNKECK